MMKIRIRYEKAGGHYHCRVFTQHNGGTFAKVGDVVLDEKDFDAMANQKIEIGLLETGADEINEIFVQIDAI